MIEFDDSWNGIKEEFITNKLKNYEFQWEYKGIEYYLQPKEGTFEDLKKTEYELWDTCKKEYVTYSSELEALTTVIIADGKTAAELYDMNLISFDILST